jgi:DNA-3-methyladenine glycosylase
LNGRKLAGKIVETEAYVGPHDLHATLPKDIHREPRSCSGRRLRVCIHDLRVLLCLNVVTEAPDIPPAVLIRALNPSKMWI